jgi:hypothetical protein
MLAKHHFDEGHVTHRGGFFAHAQKSNWNISLLRRVPLQPSPNLI